MALASQASAMEVSIVSTDTAKSLDESWTIRALNGSSYSEISYDAETGVLTGYSGKNGLKVTMSTSWDEAGFLAHASNPGDSETGHFGLNLKDDGTITGRWQGADWTNAGSVSAETLAAYGDTADLTIILSNAGGTFLKDGDTQLYGASGLKSGNSSDTNINLNKDVISAITFTVEGDATYTSNGISVVKASGTHENVTVGEVMYTGGENGTAVAINESGNDIFVGGAGLLFLQTRATGAIELNNDIYVGGSTHGSVGTRGAIDFGNDDPAGHATTIGGTIYVLEDTSFRACGTGAINILGGITDKKNIDGSANAGGSTLTVKGQGYNVSGDVSLGCLSLVSGGVALNGATNTIGTLSMDAASSLTVGASASLFVQGYVDASEATLAVNSGSLTAKDHVTAGTISITDGTLTVKGQLNAEIIDIATGTLSTEGDLVVGTMLEVLGDSRVSGNVILNSATLSIGSGGAVIDSNLTFDGEDTLRVDFSGPGAATCLNGSSLSLLGGTTLQLTNCGSGNGKTYTLFTDISALLGTKGALTLDSTSNSISNYFDTTQPGSGFWADGTLVLTDDGTLQLVLHDQNVKDAVVISTRQTGGAKYQYYAGVSFENISTGYNGGAIYGDEESTITLSNNGSVTFSGNTASGSSSAYGGAIYGSTITLSNNGSVAFIGNTASTTGFSSYAYGGAIYGDSSSTITLSNNVSVLFEGNTASSTDSSAYGGAIYGDWYSTITLSNNGSVAFSGNTASDSSYAYGGAICGFPSSTITLSNNGSVVFSGNTASTGSSFAVGGAICGSPSSTITLSDNVSVEFSGNAASGYSAYGGAIDGLSSSTITLSNNGSVLFEGNTASGSYAEGGAIYASVNLSIQNNDSVLFEKNAEIRNGTYRLRSIYAGGSGDIISLSAAAGKSIEFRDAVYIDPDSTVNLNADYGDIKQQGDIIFTGKYTEQHLNELLESAGAGRTATAQEILNSRTSEVYTMTNLYGGRLRVEDGAIYMGQGITAHAGSDATVRVKDATLSHAGYDLTFNAGTTLALVGSNSITGNLNLLAGSTLHIDFAGNEFTTNLNGSTLELTGDAFLRLTSAGKGDGKTYTLLSGVSGLVDAEGNAITLNSSNNAVSNYFDATQPGTGFWADGTLVLSDDGTLQLVLHDQDVKEAVVISTRQTGWAKYQYYEGVCFENIYTSTSADASYGGAICVYSSSSITLSNNGSVEFIGNTASSGSSSAYGGAIYGNGDITLSNNGSVVFEGNMASAPSAPSATGDDAYIRGGAIYGFNSSITLSNNGSVIFSGNTVTASYAFGGAICGDSNSTITLSDNGSVLFDENMASGLGGTVHGGAIYGNGDITLSNNGSVEFIRNTASDFAFACGGAISGSKSTIELSNNGSVEFSGNTASSDSGEALGGAIHGFNSSITLSNNGSVVFEGNTASCSVSAQGGAIHGPNSSITLSNNGSVAFIGNTASPGSYRANGGAICGSTITLSNNGSVEFSGNTVSAGSASASYGGAICGSTITLSNNGSVEFSGNTVSAGSASAYGGGAIYTYVNLSIRNNDSVLFEKNAEICGGIYRLRSIYACRGSGCLISLSAAAGKSIEFRDAVYIGSDSTVNLNADYTYLDEEGVSITVKQKGDILFTGATTVDDLYEVKGNIAGTEEEIHLSRTSEVYTMTNILGGRLRVEDGAIYQGQGITAHAGSAATVRVKDAELSHAGYDLTFNAGTTLELEGGNSIIGNVQMLDDSTLRFIYAADTTLSLAGNLSFDGSVTIELVGYGQGNFVLASQNGGALSGWDMDALRFMNGQGESLDATYFAWLDNTLYYISSVESLIWTNGAGDGLWNNKSLNWTADGTPHAISVRQNIIFASDGHETITMVGNQAVNTLTVQQGGQYTLAGDTAGTKLTVTGDVLLEENASLSIQGNLESGALKGAGSLSVSGTLTLTDATASSSIDGDVSVSGALKTAGVLTVGGALKAGSLAGGSNELAVSGNITLGSMSGDSNVLTSGGSASTGAINGSHNSITAVTLVTTNGKALTGDYNTLEATAGQVFVQGQLKGNYNTLKGGKAPADGNTISVWSGINGNNNVLLAEEGTIAMGAGSLQGDSNSLTATEGAILVKDIQGAGNKLTAGTTISIGAISSTTAGNMLTAGGNISTGAITGEGNVLSSTSGGITIGGAFKGDEGELSAKDEIVFNVGIGAEDASADYNRISSTDNIIRTANDKTTNGSHNIFIGNEVHLRGKVTGDYNTITATKRASDGNSLTIWNGLYGSNNTLTVEDGNIGNSGGLFGADNKLTTEKGNINFVNGTLGNASTCADRNILVASGLITMGAITGSANEFTAGTYIQTSSLTGDANTLTAGTYVNINGKLTGDSNDISSSGTDSGNANGIRIATGLEGDGNKLTAEAGRIVIGGGTSLNGSNNTLLAKGATSGGEGITLDGNLAGSGNKLTAETGNIKLGNITGDSNTLEAEAGTITASTINGTGNTLKGATVQVNGELKGSANTIEGNAVQVGTLSGSGHGITALAGNVTINSLNTTTGNTISTGASYGITVGGGSASNQTWTAGSLSVTGAAGLSLTDSTVTIGGTVESAKLNLGGASSLAAATLSVNSVSLLTDAAVSMTLETADVAELYLQAGATLDVNGTLNAGTVTMQLLTSSAPGLTVGQFAAGETIFCLDVEMVNALNLGHGESVVLARADQAISGDFSAWLTSTGNSSLDAAVYRYDISVSGAEVVLTMDYANWGTRVWYGNTWVGKESWSEYMVCGYDAVDGVETVDLSGSSVIADALYIAAGEDAFTTVMANGSMSAAYAEVDGKLTIAESCALEIGELAAGAQEVQLQGELTVDTGSIGKLSGTTGELVIGDEVSVNSDVTLGSLDNSGTLDIGSHSLKVASAVTNGGSVVAGNVEVHNRMSGYAVFDKLVADKVAVTNTSNSSAYTDNLSVGDGSAIGELVAEKLQVRDGVVTLGRTDAATAQTLQKLELQKDSTLVLNQQTELAVTDTITSGANATLQLKQEASLEYGVYHISNKGAGAASVLNPGGLADDTAVISNAHVAVNSSVAVSVGAQLNNSSLENAGSGKVTVINPNAGVSSLYATGGDIDMLYRDATLRIDELVLGNNTTVAVYTGAELAPPQQGAIWVDSMVEFNEDTQLNASLTINTGAELKMAETVSLSSGLALGSGMTLGGEMLTTLQEAELGSTVTLFSGIESLNLLGQEFHSLTLSGAMEASIFFSNVQDADDRYYYMVYDCPTSGAGVLSIQISEFSVPEPTTTTLSLLALAGLCARRRRK